MSFFKPIHHSLDFQKITRKSFIFIAVAFLILITYSIQEWKLVPVTFKIDDFHRIEWAKEKNQIIDEAIQNKGWFTGFHTFLIETFKPIKTRPYFKDYYRPLNYLYWLLGFRFFGTNPESFHLLARLFFIGLVINILLISCHFSNNLGGFISALGYLSSVSALGILRFLDWFNITSSCFFIVLAFYLFQIGLSKQKLSFIILSFLPASAAFLCRESGIYIWCGTIFLTIFFTPALRKSYSFLLLIGLFAIFPISLFFSFGGPQSHLSQLFKESDFLAQLIKINLVINWGNIFKNIAPTIIILFGLIPLLEKDSKELRVGHYFLILLIFLCFLACCFNPYLFCLSIASLLLYLIFLSNYQTRFCLCWFFVALAPLLLYDAYSAQYAADFLIPIWILVGYLGSNLFKKYNFRNTEFGLKKWASLSIFSILSLAILQTLWFNLSPNTLFKSFGYYCGENSLLCRNDLLIFGHKLQYQAYETVLGKVSDWLELSSVKVYNKRNLEVLNELPGWSGYKSLAGNFYRFEINDMYEVIEGDNLIFSSPNSSEKIYKTWNSWYWRTLGIGRAPVKSVELLSKDDETIIDLQMAGRKGEFLWQFHFSNSLDEISDKYLSDKKFIWKEAPELISKLQRDIAECYDWDTLSKALKPTFDNLTHFPISREAQFCTILSLKSFLESDGVLDDFEFNRINSLLFSENSLN